MINHENMLGFYRGIMWNSIPRE